MEEIEVTLDFKNAMKKMDKRIEILKRRYRYISTIYLIWLLAMCSFTYIMRQEKNDIKNSEIVILKSIKSYQEYNNDLSLQLDSSQILVDSLINLKINTKKRFIE